MRNFGKAYVEIAKRPWFNRRWVVQEVGITAGKHRTILIADEVMDYDQFVSQFRTHTDPDTAPIVTAKRRDSTLLQNLSQYHQTLSSDPLDRVYALLGLSTDSDWLDIDYTKTTEELFSAVATHYITRGNAIAVLVLAAAHKSREELWPSWVPDWREHRQIIHSGLQDEAFDTLAVQLRQLLDVNVDGRRIVEANIDPSYCEGRGRLGLLARLSHGQLKNSSKYPMDRIEASSTGGRKISVHEDKSGIRTVTESEIDYDNRTMTEASASTVRRKWLPIFEKQTQTALGGDGIFCFLRDCPYAFVLRPDGVDIDNKSYASFKLQASFQVDEIDRVLSWWSELVDFHSEQIWIV